MSDDPVVIVRNAQEALDLGSRKSFDQPQSEANREFDLRVRKQHFDEMVRRDRRQATLCMIGDAVVELDLSPEQIAERVQRLFSGVT